MSTELLKDQEVSIKLNKKYNVIMHNDNRTTFDCVIEILVEVFGFIENTAMMTAIAIDKVGSAIVGTYSKDIAETKQYEAIDMAREQGFPLELTVEEA